MMYGSQPQDEHYQEFDEHNAPTEPLKLFHPPLNPPPLADEMSMEPGPNGALPAPTPIEHPFPHLNIIPISPDYQSPAAPVYPALPSVPSSHKRKKGQLSPEGAYPIYPFYPPQPIQPVAPRTRHRRHSAIPSLVGLFFVAVQLLLLLRFLLKLINIQGNADWVSIVYSTSDIFLLPIRLIFQHITLPFPIPLELYTLIAILAYGLLSRILVSILKAILY
ncbi:MAG: hypothetical protein E6I59_18130 [Chloroflexi bacterium]|nr:MAG: hypothetical protein E6J36_09670 [Chloroflexota bacterium]TMD02817.1 MAG: hypothetical protein E6J11_00740 [Chloroflexota bacterium]TME57629.1 MAG: hypothetical protein E6I59_18130 [Chloroflexota bacterium]